MMHMRHSNSSVELWLLLGKVQGALGTLGEEGAIKALTELLLQTV